jgi:NADH:ubiquinone oxidoreductase subunit 4 (subunit M)
LFGKAAPSSQVADLRLGEAVSLAVPLLFTFWIGIAPAAIIAKTQNVVSDLTAQTSTACNSVHPVGCSAIADAGADHGD